MSTRVAINGFGRIGRCALRAAHERGSDLEIVAINDVADAATLAHLLAHDSTYCRFAADVRVEGDTLVVDDHAIRVFAEADPAQLPWRDLGVEVVLECTGHFRTRADAEQHLVAGATKVILSAPAKGAEPADADVVLGVNFEEAYDSATDHIVTNASCTTNCLAPVAAVLHEAVGIRHGHMTTIHAYTSDQHLLDAPHKDLRRARAAATNLIPTSTGAAKAIGLILPELDGRLHGYAVRVPVPTGSMVDLTIVDQHPTSAAADNAALRATPATGALADLTIEAERATSAEEVNAAFRASADTGRLAGILAYSEAPIVSADIVGSPYSSIFDAPLTSVVRGTQVKVVAWYDNEWGYANRLVELAERALAPVGAAV